ncbi:N-acetylmuramoyl-L-alanine amidase [Desulfosporosinus acidiphilus]|uniref:N-acetylmuramoyl-L-alanine amidase n=1 Tax=Desulfosporosinus acidiphilus TaxID=885581 RepID=UPI000257A9C6|nr:N-acetylmuramoyl-L-alanine amidase [Desulfosporosinus acidiphilus]
MGYYSEDSVPGKALAEKIQSQLIKLQPDNKRTAKVGDYYLLNQIKIPAVIIEVGFLSNARESRMRS